MMRVQESEQPAVEIALATYNGATYLPEFLHSLAKQTWKNLEIVASDDASKDGTISLLESFDTRPLRVIAHTKNQGVLKNFEDAIAVSTADYVFFADQDDYWESDKIEIMANRIREIESQRGKDHPILVFCDLRIVDADLNEIEESYFRNTGKLATAGNLEDYIISNHIPGCAMAVNRALIDRALPIPPRTYLHDWWFALVATTFGTMAYVPQQLIRYRQHGANTVGFGGAPQSKLLRLARYARSPLTKIRTRVAFYGAQARIVETNITGLRAAYGSGLPPAAAHLLDKMTSRRWRDRLFALRKAKTGESWTATLMITSQMWRSSIT